MRASVGGWEGLDRGEGVIGEHHHRTLALPKLHLTPLPPALKSLFPSPLLPRRSIHPTLIPYRKSLKEPAHSGPPENFQPSADDMQLLLQQEPSYLAWLEGKGWGVLGKGGEGMYLGTEEGGGRGGSVSGSVAESEAASSDWGGGCHWEQGCMLVCVRTKLKSEQRSGCVHESCP
eukprot:scaffold10984_cov18-Tisochrysis_lutea.AAC.2